MGKRKQRKGEYICRCNAYGFPHKFGSGRCKGAWIVEETWEMNYGSGVCEHCNSCNRLDGLRCDVYEGLESVQECEAWQEFVNFNEIKVYMS